MTPFQLQQARDSYIELRHQNALLVVQIVQLVRVQELKVATLEAKLQTQVGAQ